MKKSGISLIALILLTGLMAPGVEAQANPAAKTEAKTVTVKVTDDLEFIPKIVTVKAGTTVEWVPAFSGHTVKADDGSFKSKDLTPKHPFQHTFTRSGSYAYYCENHGDKGGKGMSGVVKVTP